MSAARTCRRKHRAWWTTKTLGDGRRIVVCPICGYEPAPSDMTKPVTKQGDLGNHTGVTPPIAERGAEPQETASEGDR